MPGFCHHHIRVDDSLPSLRLAFEDQSSLESDTENANYVPEHFCCILSCLASGLELSTWSLKSPMRYSIRDASITRYIL